MCATLSPNNRVDCSSFRLMEPERNNGFTLLEVLIALVLLAILTTALYGSYFAVMAARERAGEGMEARRELGSTLDRMRQQIDAAQFSAGDKRLHFVVEDRDIFGAPSSTLALTTLAEPSKLTRPESGVINSRYQIVEREKRRILTSKDQDIFFATETALEYPQMEHITGFLVECFDGSKWVRSWDTALNLKLPQQVRVTVQVQEDGKPIEFSTLAAPRVKTP